MEQKRIEQANKYFKNKVYDIETEFHGVPAQLSFKFQILGEKEMYWLGEPYPTISVKITIISMNDLIKLFLGYQNTNYEPETNTVRLEKIYKLSGDIKEYISDMVGFFSHKKYSIFIEKVDVDKNNLMESEEYGNIIDKIVKDITDVVKTLEEGEFNLPVDVSGDMLYSFTNFDNQFDVELTISHDETIPNFYTDGGYYEEEDVFEFEVVYNPKKYPSFLYDFNAEINEVVAHEFNHMLQNLRGESYKNSEDPSSREYYLRTDELDSQYYGFKRQSRITNTPMEVVVRNWFNKYGIMRGLSEEDIEIIIYEILNYKK